MSAQAQVWMPAVLSLFGTLIVVVLTAWLNTRTLSAQIDSVRKELDSMRNELRAELRGEIQSMRAEMKQSLAELELRLTKQIMELAQRIERLEETRPLVRP